MILNKYFLDFPRSSHSNSPPNRRCSIPAHTQPHPHRAPWVVPFQIAAFKPPCCVELAAITDLLTRPTKRITFAPSHSLRCSTSMRLTLMITGQYDRFQPLTLPCVEPLCSTRDKIVAISFESCNLMATVRVLTRQCHDIASSYTA